MGTPISQNKSERMKVPTESPQNNAEYASPAPESGTGHPSHRLVPWGPVKRKPGPRVLVSQHRPRNAPVSKFGIAELSLALLTATPFLAQMGTTADAAAKASAQAAAQARGPQTHNQGQQPK